MEEYMHNMCVYFPVISQFDWFRMDQMQIDSVRRGSSQIYQTKMKQPNWGPKIQWQ